MPAQPLPPPQKRTRPAARKRRSFWSELQHLHRRDLILMSGALSLACLSVLVVGLLLWRYGPTPPAPVNNSLAGTPRPRPTYTVTFTQVTGLGQFAAAQRLAQQWAKDAQLVSANADWPSVIGPAQVGEPAAWTYRFYSPAAERLYYVMVAVDGQAQGFEHPALVTLPPPVISSEAWLVDSPAALATWLDNGGGQLLRSNPGIEMMAQLSRMNNNPNPVWLVVGLNNQTEELYRVVIDANQGVVTD